MNAAVPALHTPEEGAAPQVRPTHEAGILIYEFENVYTPSAVARRVLKWIARLF